jgi:AcrR family transcriptional regulator
MTRTRKSAADRRDEIIEAAITLADEVGPDRLTTDMIARAVGLSQPGIFRHFPKKELIWEAVAEQLSERMGDVWQKARLEEPDPLRRIIAMTDAHLRLIEKTPALPGILFSRELHMENQPLRTAFFRTMNKFQKLLSGAVEEAINSGQLRKDLIPGDAAFLIIGLVQSLALRWSLSGRTLDLHTTGQHLLAVLLDGFARQNMNMTGNDQ